MSSKVYRKKIETHLIKIPPVRVTQVMKKDIQECFDESMKESGQISDIIVVKDGPNFWLSDGLHRLEAARRNNQELVECKVYEGTLLDAMLKNLATTLQGRPKASDVVRLVKELQSDGYGLTLEEIQTKTGYKRDYIERMIAIGTTHREVQKALDLDVIGVGHAFAISKIKDHDVQVRLLAQTTQFDLTIEDLEDVVSQTVEILREKAAKRIPDESPGGAPIPTAKCHFCDQEHPIQKVTGVNACMACYGLAWSYLQEKYKQGWKPGAEAAARAKMALSSVINIPVDEVEK